MRKFLLSILHLENNMNKSWDREFDNKAKIVKKNNGEVVRFSEDQWEIVADLLFQVRELETHLTNKVENKEGKKLIECCELRGLFHGAFEVFFEKSRHSEEQSKAFNWMFFLLFSGLKDGNRLCKMCLAHFLVYEKTYHGEN
jgi:hypothetical protein